MPVRGSATEADPPARRDSVGYQTLLISVLRQSSDNAESLKTFVRDAESEGDRELAQFFEGILENNLRAAQRAKEMLVPRLQREQE